MTWICQGRGGKCGHRVSDEKIVGSLAGDLALAPCWRCAHGKLQPHRRVEEASVATDRGQARHTDPATSHAAAARVRTGSAKMALLEAHAIHPSGLTDEEAARFAGLSLTSEYATRCSELMRAGYLKSTNRTRAGESGMAREVRRITEEGMRIVTR